MFYKRSTNVPISNRNETKTFEFVPEFVLSKEIISIWSRRADYGPNRNYLFSIRQILERYQNVLVSFQNNIGTYVHLFLTLLAAHCDMELEVTIISNGLQHLCTKTDFFASGRIFRRELAALGDYPYMGISLAGLALTVHWTIKPKYSGQKINTIYNIFVFLFQRYRATRRIFFEGLNVLISTLCVFYYRKTYALISN
jgi:hypothetical protein